MSTVSANHRFAALTGVVLLVLTGCVSIPDTLRTVGQRDRHDLVQTVCSCAGDPCKDSPDQPVADFSVLDADGFDLMNWNMLKGQREGWQADFSRIGRGRDLITIQEAYLTGSLRDILADAQLNWDLAPAFEFRGVRTGVLTASTATPRVLCMLRLKEPLINLPKSVLITRYALSQADASLVLANIHSVNFTLTTTHFRNHWQLLEEFLSTVDGPLIMTGDFNTWSAARIAVVEETARHLGLKPVVFEKGHPRRIFNQPVDHIYYRGLIPVDSVVHRVATSDHHPMVVTFKLDRDWYPRNRTDK